MLIATLAGVAVVLLVAVLAVALSGGGNEADKAGKANDANAGPANEPVAAEPEPEPEPELPTFQEHLGQPCLIVGLLDSPSGSYTYTVASGDEPIRTIDDLRERGTRDSLGQAVNRLRAAANDAGRSGPENLTSLGVLIVATDNAPAVAFVNLLKSCASSAAGVMANKVWLAFDEGERGIHLIPTWLPLDRRVGRATVTIRQESTGDGFRIVPTPQDDVFSVIDWKGAGDDNIAAMMVDLERMFRAGYPVGAVIELDLTDPHLTIGHFRPLLLRMAKIQAAVPGNHRAWLTFHTPR